MAHQTKMATCCYCGSRTVLQLTARSGHELACGSCGAPLHELKAMKVSQERPAKAQRKERAPKQKKIKKKKSVWKKAFGEVFDIVEDIFD